MSSTLPDMTGRSSEETRKPTNSTTTANPSGIKPSMADVPDDVLNNPELMMALIQAQQQDDLKRKIGSWVEQEYTKAKTARQPFERQWFINLAMYLGKQYMSPVGVPGAGSKLVTPRVARHRVRLVVNLIRKVVRKECAKITSGKPIPTVIPATNEDEDQTAAKVSETMLKNYFSTSDYAAKHRRWIWWGVITGAAYMKQFYDPNEKDYHNMVLPSEAAMYGEEGMQLTPEIIDQVPRLREIMETPQPAQGKICLEVVTPFNLFVPDLMLEELEDQPFIIHTSTVSPQYVKQRYGLDVAPDVRASQTVLESATLITKGSQGNQPDAVLVKECWIKPGGHPNFPEGGMLTVISGQCVQFLTQWPLPFPEYPFYSYNGIPTGGFYDDSVIVDLIAPQKEYNRKRSQMIEIQNAVGKPKIVYQKGSINPRMINTEPGQSIPYEMGFDAPVVVPGVEVPMSMMNEVQQLRTEIDDISGQHEISNGQVPSGVTSGTAITYLQEQDDTMLGYQVAGIEKACEYQGTHYLKFVTTYWKEDRIIRVSGRNQAYESIHWKKNAAKGNTDVKIQPGSALPNSKAAKQAFITEMMQLGFMAPEVGLEILDLGNYEKAMGELLIDKQQAQRENLKMATGPEKMFNLLMKPTPDQMPQEDKDGNIIVFDPEMGPAGGYKPFQPQPPVPVNSWDNHEAHIQYHNEFRKTQEFELLSEARKKAFELHVQTHQVALSSAMVNMQGTVLQQSETAPVGMPQEPDLVVDEQGNSVEQVLEDNGPPGQSANDKPGEGGPPTGNAGGPPNN